jgi:hypothetical protein
MKLVNVLVVGFLGTLMVAGCSSTSDSSTDGGTDGGTVTDTGSSGDTAKPADTGAGETATEGGASCTDCTTANCKTQNDACATDPNCVKGVACLAACTDSACKNDCISNADGAGKDNAKLNDFVACVKSSCASSCNL